MLSPLLPKAHLKEWACELNPHIQVDQARPGSQPEGQGFPAGNTYKHSRAPWTKVLFSLTSCKSLLLIIGRPAPVPACVLHDNNLHVPVPHL
jgi:hypothetical protein